MKGVKLARFDLIPAGPHRELAEHYGVGAFKYADHQWRQGYEWGKSIAALERHFNDFKAGKDFDVCSNDPGGCSHVDADGNPFKAAREDACFNHTGSHHMVAVAWHAFGLLEFKDRFPEHDDRYKAPKKLTGGDAIDFTLPETLTFEFKDVSPEALGLAAGVVFAPPPPPATNLEAVTRAAKDLESAQKWDEEHPEDPHGSDDVDYRLDALDEAIRQYRENGPDAAPEVRPVGPEWHSVGYLTGDIIVGSGDRLQNLTRDALQKFHNRT